MKTVTGKFIFGALMLVGFCLQQSKAQYKNTTAKEDPAYAQVIQKRVEKIVEPLKLKSAEKASQTSRVIEQQYFDLNRIYQVRNDKVKALKANNTMSKEAQKEGIDGATQLAADQVKALHPQYIGRLNALLKPDQVAEVKDGMTYHTLEVTYKAYTEMLPDLTKTQKKQLMDWLVEAREYAIDGGTSEEKHGWFGKYKGRINNYLSKEGVDMKTAEIAWKKRQQAAKN